MLGRVARVANAFWVNRTVYGPDPIALAMVDRLNAYSWLGISGHTGTIIAGEPADRGRRFAGDLGPHQAFAGAAPLLGASRNLRGSSRTALPATVSPRANQPTTLMDQLARRGL